MHAKLQRYVDDGFMTEEQAKYIEDAIDKGETLIASGHRSANVKNLMAATMSIVMEKHSTVRVKTVEDTKKDGKYLLIPAFGDDFLEVLTAALGKKGASVVTMKIPENPFSVIKIMNDAYKADPDPDKVIHLMECNKVDGVPKLMKFSRMAYNEAGRAKRTDTD
jgi:hypothetical protein